jgi:hypothetical protein
VATV